MELWLLRLACVFEDSPGERDLAGRHGSELTACVRELGSLSSELHVRATRVLDEASTLIEARNAIVHNVWPEPGREYGHRPAASRSAAMPQSGSTTASLLAMISISYIATSRAWSSS
jgi:hypothetical protein